MTHSNWLTIDELASMLSKSNGAIRVQLHRNQNKIKTQYEIIPTGRQLQISVNSLLENKWITPEQAERLSVRQSIAIDATEGNQLLASSAVRKQFNNLSESEERLLNGIPDWQKMNRSKLVLMLSELLKVSRAWLYRDHSIDKRKDKDSAIETLTSEQLQIVQQTLLQCRMKKAFIEKCINNESLPDLSPRTWYRINTQLGVAMSNELAFIKDGPEKMRSRLSPILRDKTLLKPLEVIVGDFWRVDFATKWIDGSLVRPSCAIWVDWRTHKIVGVALTKFPNSLGVKTSLLDCFVHYGIPFHAYIDNGKEYVAHRVIGTKVEEKLVHLELNDVDDKLKVFEAKGFLPSLGINSKRALKRNPTTKIVERLFGRGGFSDYAKEFSNWIGENYWKTPEAVARATRKFKKNDDREFYDDRTGEVIHFMNMEELASAIQSFVNRHNERASSGFGMDGRSPNQLWSELSLLNPPRRAPAEKIAFHFMEGKTVKIRQTGFIEYKKHFFFTSERLLRLSGRTVNIRWNPIDGFWWNRGDGEMPEFLPNSIFVYDEHGEYLTTTTLVNRNHPINADVTTMMQTKMQIIKESKENVNDLLNDKPTIVDIKTHPNEVLEKAEEHNKELKEAEEQKVKKNNPFRNTFI